MTIDTPDWVRDAVFYQIFPDRFAASDRVPKPGPLEPWDAPPTNHGFKGGDLLGIAERLPYLADLGVNALYLTPIFASASNHRYHTYDYFRVDPLLGGDDALRELLDAAHARGIRVVLDGVFNHTGRGFWAFHHVLETGAGSPYRNWFHFDQAALEAGRPVVAYPGARERSGVGSSEPVVGETQPPGGGSSLQRFGYQAWWDMPALPKLNTDDPGVREHLFAAAEHWIRFGIDGWRLDVPEEIRDAAFWQEFRRRVRALNPEAYLVGEIWGIAPDWLRGDRFDALMNYPLAQAVLSFTGAGHLNEGVLRSHHEYGPNVHELDGVQFAARLETLMGAYAREVVESQLNLLDSHDSPRYHSLVGGDRASYLLAVLLQATLPGAPCIYYGDEVGLAGGIDPDCRRGFPPEADWDRGLLAFVRAAMALRRAEPALRRGEFAILGSAGSAMAFERTIGGQRLLVALNAGESRAALRVDLPGSGLAQASAVELPGLSAGTARIDSGGSLELDLPGRSGTVFRTA